MANPIKRRKEAPISLTQAILQCLEAHSVCTINRVITKVGHLVSAATAVHYARVYTDTLHKFGYTRHSSQYTYKQLVESGKRVLISSSLRVLYSRGLILRPSRGVYGPLSSGPRLKLVTEDPGDGSARQPNLDPGPDAVS